PLLIEGVARLERFHAANKLHLALDVKRLQFFGPSAARWLEVPTKRNFRSVPHPGYEHRVLANSREIRLQHVLLVIVDGLIRWARKEQLLCVKLASCGA